MTDLVVRRLLIDLNIPFASRWNGGDAFRSAFFSALSMSFPVGEQFFIDSVKKGVATLAPGQQACWDEALRGFVGQEATHRFLHAQFNAELERQGLENHWQHWVAWRIERGRDMHPVNHVAVTAAYEHFTAVLATGLLLGAQHGHALPDRVDEELLTDGEAHRQRIQVVRAERLAAVPQPGKALGQVDAQAADLQAPGGGVGRRGKGCRCVHVLFRRSESAG